MAHGRFTEVLQQTSPIQPQRTGKLQTRVRLVVATHTMMHRYIDSRHPYRKSRRFSLTRVLDLAVDRMYQMVNQHAIIFLSSQPHSTAQSAILLSGRFLQLTKLV